SQVVQSQAGGFWNWHFFGILFPMFVVFFVSGLAETNRAPFDLPEAEAELVSGHNVEYSSMTFAMLFLGESANRILMTAMPWVRATFPRYRYDQLMRLGWKVFLPLSLFWVIFTAGWLLVFNEVPPAGGA